MPQTVRADIVLAWDSVVPVMALVDMRRVLFSILTIVICGEAMCRFVVCNRLRTLPTAARPHYTPEPPYPRFH